MENTGYGLISTLLLIITVIFFILHFFNGIFLLFLSQTHHQRAVVCSGQWFSLQNLCVFFFQSDLNYSGSGVVIRLVDYESSDSENDIMEVVKDSDSITVKEEQKEPTTIMLDVQGSYKVFCRNWKWYGRLRE